MAMKTASSFDVNYAYTNFGIVANNSTGLKVLDRTLTSNTGFQIDYNVALFDAKTVVSLSFLQFLSSNLGPIPLTRMGIGVAYHFLRMNGQRLMLDNGVEGKVWGVSPALELSLGLSKVSIKDPLNSNTEFTTSAYDAIPRVLFEVPITPNFLVMLRVGYLTSLSFGQNKTAPFTIKYSGAIYTLGVKLTTL